MFWSDWSVDTISRAKLDGSEVTVLVTSGLSAVGKVARSPYILSYACINLNMHISLKVSCKCCSSGALYIHYWGEPERAPH